MINPDSKENLPVCQYCMERVNDDERRYCCSTCGMIYHIECWEKGNGCAVLSCSQKNILLNPLFQSSVPVKELLIHIEYLLNLKKYTEAINECNRILSAEKSNMEAKVYYNRAISALNVKMKIFDSAEESFKRKEYKAASMFYNDYLRYCDEEEGDFIKSKIKYLDELLPKLKRKNALLNVLYVFIFMIILFSAGFLAYQFIYLKEDTEFAEIERLDDFSDIKQMEAQISRYEKFIIKYSDGKLKENAADKIRLLAAEIALKICDHDWRSALVYLKKLDSKEIPITYKNIYESIVKNANIELSTLKSEAKDLNSRKKYTEAKDKIEKSLAITDHFSDSEFNKIRQTLYDNKNLINKKISLIIKSKEIEKEISAKTTELKNSDPNLENENIIQIAGKVMKKSGEFTIIKSYDDKKLYALKKPSENYEIGEEIVISAIKKGKTEISDDASNTMILPVIFEISGSQFEKDGVTKESILQRLNYLKNEKGKIDSLLKLGI